MCVAVEGVMSRLYGSGQLVSFRSVCKLYKSYSVFANFNFLTTYHDNILYSRWQFSNTDFTVGHWFLIIASVDYF